MPFPTEWKLKPDEGAEQISFGMSYDQVVSILGEPDQPLSGLWRSDTKRAGWREGGLAIHFHPSVIFIEFSRDIGLVPKLLGIDVFSTPAAEVVTALESEGHSFDATDPELGHTYVFPAIQVGLWRQVLPEADDDEEGRYFDTVSAGRDGYYTQ